MMQKRWQYTMRAGLFEVRVLCPEEHRELANEIMDAIAKHLDAAFPDERDPRTSSEAQ